MEGREGLLKWLCGWTILLLMKIILTNAVRETKHANDTSTGHFVGMQRSFGGMALLVARATAWNDIPSSVRISERSLNNLRHSQSEKKLFFLERNSMMSIAVHAFVAVFFRVHH